MILVHFVIGLSISKVSILCSEWELSVQILLRIIATNHTNTMETHLRPHKQPQSLQIKYNKFVVFFFPVLKQPPCDHGNLTADALSRRYNQ